MQTCTACRQAKPASEFISKKNKPCKTCVKCRERSYKSRQKNKAAQKEANLKWKETNKEYIKEYQKNYREKTLDTFKKRGHAKGKPSKQRKEHIIQEGIELKACSGCKEYKPLGNYVASSQTWDKLRSTCNDCLHEERMKNREKMTSYNKEYWQKTKAEQTEKRREWKAANREHVNAYSREYRKEWEKKQRDTNPQFAIKKNMRNRVWHALKDQHAKKLHHTFELVGCTVAELKEHLESQFKPGMSWDNYGKWHVDHIKPCCKFDLTLEEEQLKCFNYANLQPLWGSENCSKGGKYDSDDDYF